MAGESWSEAFERPGTWWNLRDPETKVVGRLIYSPRDGLRLLTAAGPRLVPDPASFDQPSAFAGWSQGRYWTLCECQFRSSSSAAGEEYLVGYAFDGLWLEEADLEGLDEIHISFEGCWSAVDARPRGAQQLGRPNISLSAAIADGLTIEFASELVDLESSVEGGFAYRDRLKFVGKTTTPMSFPALVSRVVRPLLDLMTFTLQRGACIAYCAVSGPGTTVSLGTAEQRESVAVYWHLVSASGKDLGQSSKPVLWLHPAPEGFQQLMTGWFATHSALDLPLGLRLADLVAGMTYSPTRFLLVAQALEALHRRLYPEGRNDAGIAASVAALAKAEDAHRAVLATLLMHADEPTFRQRVKQLREEAEPEISDIVGPRLSDAVGAIVDARNAVTHWDPNVREPEGLRLVALRMVSDAIFDVVLLKRIGLNGDGLRAVVDSHQAKHVRYWFERALAET